MPKRFCVATGHPARTGPEIDSKTTVARRNGSDLRIAAIPLSVLVAIRLVGVRHNGTVIEFIENGVVVVISFAEISGAVPIGVDLHEIAHERAVVVAGRQAVSVWIVFASIDDSVIVAVDVEDISSVIKTFLF